MSRRHFSVIISILLHVILIVIVSTINRDDKRRAVRIPMTLETIEPKVQENIPIHHQSYKETKKNITYKEKPIAPESNSQLPVRDSLLSLNSFRRSLIKPVPDSTVTSKTNVIRDTLVYIQNKMKTWKNKLSLKTVNMNSSDKIDQYVYERTHGHSIRASSKPPLQFKKSPKKPKFDFIPSEIQIIAMKALYQNPKSVQNDLYKNIPDSLPMTIELFEKELDFLTNKGFMTKKKRMIKPPLLFFGIPLHFNKKSRRNPIFEYSPNIPKERLMAYLQSLGNQKNHSKVDKLLLRIVE